MRNEGEEDEDEKPDSLRIEWRNVIFLQFHPLFQAVILVAAVIKTFVGPISAIFPEYFFCNVPVAYPALGYVRYMYMYCVTPVILLDLFLHIMHRQISDVARKREYLPKSAFLLLLDVVSIIPLFQLSSENECPGVQFWPNVLTLAETVLIYRVVQYFGMSTSHSIWNLSLGFTTLFVIILNAMTCFWLLLTIHGLCKRCNDPRFSYDWRYFLINSKLNNNIMSFELYSYAAIYLCSSLLSYVMCNIISRTWLELHTNNLLQIFAYALMTHIVRPRIFCETVLRLKKNCLFQLHVVKVINETKRRTSDKETLKSLKQFYQLLLTRRNGIMNIPSLLYELPHTMYVAIKEDLVWPVFYHSPIFRPTSDRYKRYIAKRVEFDYKIPGEQLLSGYYTEGNLIYLKSGIIEFMTTDDNKTSLMSARSGTVIGDASFLVPPRAVHVVVSCSTYCEVLYIKRHDIITSLQKFPDDSIGIYERVRGKFNHARNLHVTKKKADVIDITEDCGISWLKNRWIQISKVLNYWRRSSMDVTKTDHVEIPPEKDAYHCSKYIGQIVLAANLGVNRKVIQNASFPWVFVPASTFLKVWEKIVKFTVLTVFIFFPPCLRRYSHIVHWFANFEFWVDIIYTLDMLIIMSVPMDTASLSIDFVNVLFLRIKTMTFVLNLLSTPLLPILSKLVGLTQHYRLCQFCRLVKIYIFYVETYSKPPVNRDPFMMEIFKNTFHYLAFVYISGYVIYLISDKYIHGIDSGFFFCEFTVNHAVEIPIYWYSLLYVSNCATKFMQSIYLKIVIAFLFYFTNIYVKAKMFAIVYFQCMDWVTCQLFVSSMLSKYKLYQVHPHLINRLTKYTACYWKLYRGSDFLVAEDMLKEEPYDVYYKVRGQFAESTIMNSSAFRGADISLIKDLAFNSKFLIVPKYSTLFSFGTQCDSVAWVVNGQIKCEYYDKSGALVSKMYPKGEMLSLGSVFFGKISPQTYIAHTDCEIIHMNIHVFKGILGNYPIEKKCFDVCHSELGAPYNKMLKIYIRKHREYIKNKAKKVEVPKPKIQEKVLKSLNNFICANQEAGSWKNRVLDFFNRLWIDPSKKFMRYWLPFRASVALIAVVAGACEGSVAIWRRGVVSSFLRICDTLTLCDMILKCFVAHYNNNGVLIYAPRKRILNYVTRSFIPDFVGVVPWVQIVNFFSTTPIGDMKSIIWGSYARCAHLYIFLGYCDYRSDWPNSNGVAIMCIKWQILALCLKMVSAQHLLGLCYDDTHDALHHSNFNTSGTCFFGEELENYSTERVFLHIYGRSLLIAQFNSMGANFGKPSNARIAQINTLFYIPFLIMDIMFWFITVTCIVLLFLYFRKNSLLGEDIKQLRTFLASERADKTVIKRARAHFKYWWNRSGGMNIINPFMQRVGIVLRQDMMLYLYKVTIDSLGEVIGCSSHSKRVLASVCEPIYFLPGEDIMREMRIVRYVYIVHRGRVTITRNEKKLATLTKGAIFGQLSGGAKERAVKVTARTDDLADILAIPHSQFQYVFSEKVKANISELAVNDYIPMSNIKVENPYNSIQYLTRGIPTVYFPRAKMPRSIKNCQIYAVWLQTAWLAAPMVGSISSGMLLLKAPRGVLIFSAIFAVISDTIHLVYLIIEFFFSVNLQVQGDHCVHKRERRKKLKQWWLYVEILSFLMVIHIPLTGLQNFHCLRILRLKYFYDYYKHFCYSFRKTYKPLLLNGCCVLLCVFFTVIFRMKFECEDTAPEQTNILPDEIFDMIVDRDEYVHANERTQGCILMIPIPEIYITNENQTSLAIAPKTWAGDFITAVCYILLLNFDYFVLNPEHEQFNNWAHVWLEIVLYTIILFLHLIMSGKAIAIVYMKFRKMLRYDYRVANLLSFLQREGITKTLSLYVEKYCRQLWERHGGNMLPELTMEAPECLKEDIMCALYYHHLSLPPLFRQLPEYFLRQIATLFHRHVIFAGVDIVQQGDVLPNIFFIHEGEVEKYYVDKNGNKRVVTILTTNGYFGFVASMFPKSPYMYAYGTRTVVDLVYLKYDDWKTLLSAYPDINTTVEELAFQLKREMFIKS